MALKAVKTYTSEEGDEMVELYENNGVLEMSFYGYQLGPMRVKLPAGTDADALAATIIANKPNRKSLRATPALELIANAERVIGLKVY